MLRPPGWVGALSEWSDVVLGVEVSAFRNLSGRPFGNHLTPDDRDEIAETMLEAAGYDVSEATRLGSLSVVQRRCLVERLTLPSYLTKGYDGAAVMVDEDERFVVVAGGLDHLFVRATAGPLAFDESYAGVTRFVGLVDRQFSWARHESYGYLSPNPAACGAGVMASAMCHVPALFITRKVGDLELLLEPFGAGMQSLWREEVVATSAFVRIYSRALVGKRPDDVIKSVERAARAVVSMERDARNELAEKSELALKDKIHRAFGVATNAVVIELWEMFSLLSVLRLGAAMELLDIPLHRIDELLFVAQPAHIMSAHGEALDPSEVAQLRAKILREGLEESQEGFEV